MRIRNEKGFTLIELLIAIFIIGVIMAISIPNLKAAGEKAQAKACQANQKLIYAQMENYFLEHGEYPSQGIDPDTERPTFIIELYKDQLLDQIPTCPADGEYIYKEVPDEISGKDKLVIECTIPEHNLGE